MIRLHEGTPTYTDIRLIASMSSDEKSKFAHTIQKDILDGKANKCPDMLKGQIALLKHMVVNHKVDIDYPVSIFSSSVNTTMMVGFPKGEVRIKVRAADFTVVCVKTKDAVFKYLPGTMGGYIVPLAILDIDKRQNNEATTEDPRANSRVQPS